MQASSSIIDQALLKLDGSGKEHPDLFRLGVKLANICVPFVLYIQEQCLQAGHSEVYYFTREGEFLLAIHETLAKSDPFGVPVPAGKLLEVSRMATFAASLNDISLQDLNRFWTMYPAHSMRAFFISLDIPIEPFEKHLQSHGLPPDEILLKPWKDSRFVQLVADPVIRHLFRSALGKKKIELETYLGSKGISKTSGKPLAVVDIGWRGTIQDNLALVLTKRQLEGYYFGLFRYLNEQPGNVTKSAFGPNENVSPKGVDSLNCQAAIEMLFNSPNGSVRGYQTDIEGNPVVRRLIDDSENAIFNKFTRHIQEGVLEAASIIGTMCRLRGLKSGNLRSKSLSELRKLHHKPPRSYAVAFFELNHNETFGNGLFIQRSAKLNWRSFTQALMNVEGRLSLKQTISDSGWPEAMFVVNDLGWLNGTYRLTRKFLKQIQDLTEKKQ